MELAPKYLERFVNRFSVSQDGHWLWQGSIDMYGYGRIHIGHTKYYLVHRVSYELFVGPIPGGLTIDHLCRIKHCINPDHLEPVTLRENILRSYCPPAINARQRVCQNGHIFSRRNYNGQRMCKTCRRIYQREKRALNRARGVKRCG